MSHIPSAAMPHAKPHEAETHKTTPPALPPREKNAAPLPWVALAAGGVIAIGGVVATALLLRDRDQRKSSDRSPAKGNRVKGRAAKPRKAKSSEENGG